jgi:hypothetical protein
MLHFQSIHNMLKHSFKILKLNIKQDQLAMQQTNLNTLLPSGKLRVASYPRFLNTAIGH